MQRDGPTPERATEALSMALEVIGREVPIVCAYLFGSRVRGDAASGSDYDVAVFLGGADRDVLRLELELGRRVQRESGISPVDLRVVDHAPLRIRGKVLTEGRLLYCGDDAARVAIERDTRVRYFEFRWRLDRLDREWLRHAAEEGLPGG